MAIALDRKELVKYPFLKESQQMVRRHTDSLDSFLSGSDGQATLARAKERAFEALNTKYEFSATDVHRLRPELEIASYALARILVSCAGDRVLIDRLTRYEAARAIFFLESDDSEDREEKKRFIARSVEIDPDSDRIPVTAYVELVTQMRDPCWRLVNRDVTKGFVHLQPHELDELLRERIRILMHRQLPLRVPATICELLAPVTEELVAASRKNLLEQFGSIEEESFPPCIGALIRAISAGTNLPHMGRFAITSFLHTIGMSPTGIVEIFARAPDFDIGRTMYQVEHISGRGGTEYTPPSCATMRTFGICTNRDKLCEDVNHPLTYYRKKKSDRKKKD
jgi:DNA primase large subunit